ncbi:hypothetical protein HK107_02945 [Parvularcula sp. ZS-1/3]|uniref:Uncharacterized protein n=1 Tax=Parvularcula mediterranea TaxID=2732508 RepID=A0A7Y3RL03_9PROT|nr:hypothetical protein [Parvularcula mediterranea]NNU15282.1 hypothetical protein [Parvularcula mediterranea]
MIRILAAACVLLTSFASAEISASKAKEVLNDTNAATLGPVLRAQGLFPETLTIENREVLVVRQNGNVVMLRPRVCNPDCTGLLMYIVMEGAAPASSINAFNQQTPATVAYTNGQATVLSRYLIADHGITAGTFLVNLDVFSRTVSKWTQTRNARNAMSVSLLSSAPIDDYDPDTEALVREALRRPELLSGRIVSDY